MWNGLSHLFLLGCHDTPQPLYFKSIVAIGHCVTPESQVRSARDSIPNVPSFAHNGRRAPWSFQLPTTGRDSWVQGNLSRAQRFYN
jgi:hypothetical protein